MLWSMVSKAELWSGRMFMTQQFCQSACFVRGRIASSAHCVCAVSSARNECRSYFRRAVLWGDAHFSSTTADERRWWGQWSLRQVVHTRETPRYPWTTQRSVSEAEDDIPSHLSVWRFQKRVERRGVRGQEEERLVGRQLRSEHWQAVKYTPFESSAP